MLVTATDAWIGLGANLSDARATLRLAVQRLAELPQTRLQQVSGLYGSAPVDAGGPDYLNAVALLQTRLPALALLQALQALEAQAGRERPYRNAPRTLDLDVLLYGSQRIDLPQLTVPHPRMYQRAFVLLPLAELAPQQVSPGQRQAVAHQTIDLLETAPQWLAPG